MFLTQEPHNIEDFLKSVDFVTPPGMNLKYFIVPLNSVDNTFTTISTESGYSPEQELNVPGVTDTITYTKRMPVEKNAMASANFDASAKPGVFPTHVEPAKPQSVDDEIIKHGGRIPSAVGNIYADPNEVAAVMESIDRKDDLTRALLKEAIGCFPKNTLLCFEKLGE